MNPVDEFPAELGDRLQRLVDLETSGSSPWPGVDVAVRRSHRRRMAGVSTLAAAGVLAGGFLFTGLSQPNALKEPVPAGTSMPSPSATVVSNPVKKNLTLAAAGYSGATGGPLADDRAWLTALRNRVKELNVWADREVKSPADVHVLWAGDLNGTRHALVLLQETGNRKPHRTTWSSMLLRGPAGARAQIMNSFDGDAALATGLSTATFADFAPAAATNSPAKHTAAMFVRAPFAKTVEVATGRRFFSDGRVSTTWRPLKKQGGSVWVGELDADEFYLGEYRVDGRYPGTGVQPDNALGESLDGRDRPDDGSQALAPDGTDLDALAIADRQVQARGPSVAERAVIATSTPVDSKNALAASVLRAPDGGYLIGLAERQVLPMSTRDKMFHAHKPPARSQAVNLLSRNPFARPDDVMAAVVVPGSARNTPRQPDPHYLVLAPAGAVTVRSGPVSATVHHRLAVLDLAGASDQPGVEVQAVAADGTVITSVKALDGLSGDHPEQAQVAVMSESANLFGS